MEKVFFFLFAHSARRIKENAERYIAQVTVKAGFITAYFSRPGNYCLLRSHALPRTYAFTLDLELVAELYHSAQWALLVCQGFRFDPWCLQHLRTHERGRKEFACCIVLFYNISFHTSMKKHNRLSTNRRNCAKLGMFKLMFFEIQRRIDLSFTYKADCMQIKAFISP